MVRTEVLGGVWQKDGPFDIDAQTKMHEKENIDEIKRRRKDIPPELSSWICEEDEYVLGRETGDGVLNLVHQRHGRMVGVMELCPISELSFVYRTR